MHETSKRLSQTLRDIYESDWFGVEELPVITEVSLGCIYIGINLNFHSLTARAFGLMKLLEKKKLNGAIITHPTVVEISSKSKSLHVWKNMYNETNSFSFVLVV